VDSRDSDLRQVTAALHDLPDDAPVLDAAMETARLLGAALVVTRGLPVSFAERSVGLASVVEHSRRCSTRPPGGSSPRRPASPLSPGWSARPHELVGEDLDTGLLIVGGPRRHGHDDLGLVARTALHHATCPVLIVPR
jgi:hypothetical protein